MHIFHDMLELPKDFNDTISSFVVLGGKWQMFDGKNFELPLGSEFMAGMYTLGDSKNNKNYQKYLEESKENPADQESNLKKYNDVISSIKLIGAW